MCEFYGSPSKNMAGTSLEGEPEVNLLLAVFETCRHSVVAISEKF